MAGTSQLAAPITSDGVVLSHHAQQHDAVDQVRADRLLDVHADEIAKEHRRWPHVRLARRGDGEFDRQPAALPRAAFDVLGDDPEMSVTWGELGPGVADANHGTPVEHIGGKLIAHPAAVDEAVFVVLAEPGGGSVGSFFVCDMSARPRVRSSVMVRWSASPACAGCSRDSRCARSGQGGRRTTTDPRTAD